jgi:hypothetical protein
VENFHNLVIFWGEWKNNANSRKNTNKNNEKKAIPNE